MRPRREATLEVGSDVTTALTSPLPTRLPMSSTPLPGPENHCTVLRVGGLVRDELVRHAKSAHMAVHNCLVSDSVPYTEVEA